MSEHEQEEQDSRNLKFLRPWIDAALADSPEEAQWEAARRDVLSQIESRGRKRGLFAGRERHRAGTSRRRWYRRVAVCMAAAAAATVVLIVALRRPQTARKPVPPQQSAPHIVARVETAWGRCVVLNQDHVVGEEDTTSFQHGRTRQRKEKTGQPIVAEGGGPGAPGPLRSATPQKVAGKLLSSGDVLEPGDHVLVGPRGGLDLRGDDGSKMWLCSDTEVVCVGPRLNHPPALRLVRGEIRANIIPSRQESFSIEAPATTLHALGTEYHVRVLPDLFPAEDVKREETGSDVSFRRLPVFPQIPAMSLATAGPLPEAQQHHVNEADAQQAATIVVTVLSGAVAIEGRSGQRVVNEGERVVIETDGSTSGPEEVKQIQYLRTLLDERLGKPKDNAFPETLFFVPIREGLLHSLMAVDPQSGNARSVTTFVGYSSHLLKRFAPGLAYVETYRLHLSEFTGRGIGDNGQLGVESQIRLVDLVTGAKLPLLPLRDVESYYMQLSPDRRKLALLGRKVMGDPSKYESGLFVLDLETLGLKTLLGGDLGTSPHWSPDSRWLAISKSPPDQNHHEIVLIDTIGGEVMETGLEGAGVYFTPDGKRLLYSSGFHEARGWSAGVPTWGNLFMADIPRGKPEQITHLPQGGAIQPTLSPDGSKLLYWEVARPAGESLPSRLHEVDVETGKDRVVAEDNYLAAFDEVRWLDDNSRVCFSFEAIEEDPTTRTLKRRPKVRLVSLGEGGPCVEDLTPPAPRLPEAYIGSFKPLADRLVGAFSRFQDALDAQDFHRIEEARAKFLEARDLFRAILEDCKQAKKDLAGPIEDVPFTDKPLNLSASLALDPDDLEPYLQALDSHAALTPTERSVKVVRSNLLGYMAWFLRLYYEEFGRLPPIYDQSMAPFEVVDGQPNRLPDFREWMQQILKPDWKINHIRGTDSERARRLLVVPGDDPDKVLTSYKAVRSSPAGDEFVLRTPVLANGKRLEVTYRAHRVSERTVHVEAEAREIE